MDGSGVKSSDVDSSGVDSSGMKSSDVDSSGVDSSGVDSSGVNDRTGVELRVIGPLPPPPSLLAAVESALSGAPLMLVS